MPATGKRSPNIGRPLRDCSRVASSRMTSLCSASTPILHAHDAATTHAAGRAIPLNRPSRMPKAPAAAATWFSYRSVAGKPLTVKQPGAAGRNMCAVLDVVG